MSNKKENNTFPLFNRDGDNVYLEELKPNKYLLHTPSQYMRVINSSRNKDLIMAIDPSGGPFISIGNPITEINETVKCIEHKKGVGFIIETV